MTEKKPSREGITASAHDLQADLDRHREELEAQNEDLRNANAALVAVSERYRRLYEGAPVAYATLDRARHIVELNAAAAALFGATREAMRGRSFDDVVSPSLRQSFRAFHERVLADGARLVDETVIAVGERRFPARIEAVRLGEDPAAAECLLCLSDETERRHAADERRQLEAKVAEAFRVESLGLLAGGVAHDFKNVLAFALGHLELAMIEAAGNEAVGEPLKAVRDALDRAAHLSRQLLTYSGRSRLAAERLDVSSVIGSMKALLSTAAPKSTLVFELADDLPPVLGENVAIQQIVLNLVVNAAEALLKNGRIVVRTRSAAFHESSNGRPRRAAVIEVQDDGRGMDETVRSRAFDPFFSTKGEGRGIGLSVVHGNVRAHGGVVTVESASNQGTIVRVHLPEASGDPTAPVDSPTFEPTWRGSGLVLVVDDNRNLRHSTGALLESMGFDVCYAVDGIDAVVVATERRGQLTAVLLDLAMPRMGGEEALVELKRLDAAVPIVLMTGLSLPQVRMTATTTADGFLAKPFTLAELAIEMHRVVSRRPTIDRQR